MENCSECGAYWQCEHRVETKTKDVRELREQHLRAVRLKAQANRPGPKPIPLPSAMDQEFDEPERHSLYKMYLDLTEPNLRRKLARKVFLQRARKALIQPSFWEDHLGRESKF